jgi:hypothetical protein
VPKPEEVMLMAIPINKLKKETEPLKSVKHKKTNQYPTQE